MIQNKETWERAFCPSGELEEIFKLAERFRASEHAPAVRLDHFLLAFILVQMPWQAGNILKVCKHSEAIWRMELKGRREKEMRHERQA